MAMKITLSLDETVYERAKLLAQLQRQDVAKALAHWLDETLPLAELDDVRQTTDDDPDVEREMQAYIALHPQLVQQYRDQYVAVHQGQLVDHDSDYGALLLRIEATYPDQFVWITKVEEQPLRQFVHRSPRITRVR